MNRSRRQILKGLVVAACSPSAVLAQPASRPNLSLSDDVLVGGYRFRDIDLNRVKQGLSVVNVTTGQQWLAPLAFLPHGITSNPTNKRQLALFEKHGGGGALLDIDGHQPVRAVTPKKGCQFYGHGVFSKAGEALFVTETQMTDYHGVITVRDNSDDAQYMADFPSYGVAPHDCQLVDDGTVLVVTNGGGGLSSRSAPNVAWIDIASQRLLERRTISNAQLNAGHFAISPRGEMVVVSAPRKGLPVAASGGVSLWQPGHNVIASLDIPRSLQQHMRGEALSVLIHPKKPIALVTHPDGNVVTIWSTQSQKLLTHINLERPRGVTLTKDLSKFIVSYSQQALLATIDVDEFSLSKSLYDQVSYFTGSHVYNWSDGGIAKLSNAFI